MKDNQVTVEQLVNVRGRRATRDLYTKLMLEHQQELRDRGIPTGPDAGPAPAGYYSSETS